MGKMQTVSILKNKLIILKRTVEDLDQQAKLIIRSDMKLKLYEQEIDDKMSKLSLIKNLIISSLHILDKDKLFFQINEKLVNDLGFKRSLLLDFNNLQPRVNIGFEKDEIQRVQNTLNHKREILRSNQLLDKNSEIYKQLFDALKTKDVLIAPIKIREQADSIFLVSNLILRTGIQKSEEEVFLIICMYLGQCLDNINLFEDLYHTKDNLEKKIKERTNELVKSLREIEVINKAKSDFISSVSHELRTPLTSVKGFSSLLVDEKFGKLPEKARERLMKIDDNVDKLMHIVNTLLDISRIESGKMEVKIAPFEITKIIKDLGDFLSPQLDAKKINLNLNLPGSLTVYMDKNLIERVLINLINNAIKFTPEEGSITVECKQQNSQAIVSVADTGYGISKEDLPKIFEEFYRVNNPAIRQIKGSGLGLSLVKRIIDTHKEKIWVESEVNKGTKFYFTLKVAENV